MRTGSLPKFTELGTTSAGGLTIRPPRSVVQRGCAMKDAEMQVNMPVHAAVVRAASQIRSVIVT
jgi:hypothetical protein